MLWLILIDILAAPSIMDKHLGMSMTEFYIGLAELGITAGEPSHGLGRGPDYTEGGSELSTRVISLLPAVEVM